MFLQYGLFGKGIWSGLNNQNQGALILLIVIGVVIAGLLVYKQYLLGLIAIGIMLVCIGFSNTFVAVVGVLIFYIVMKYLIPDSPGKNTKQGNRSDKQFSSKNIYIEARKKKMKEAYEVYSHLSYGHLTADSMIRMEYEFRDLERKPEDAHTVDIDNFLLRWSKFIYNPEPHSEKWNSEQW